MSAPACQDPAVADLQRALEKGEEFILATGPQARQFSADLLELRARRLKTVGGSVFKRARSRYWQIKYLVNGKWRYESTRAQSRREAEHLLAFKVYQASTGMLPGTASFEQLIALLVDDAKVRGLKAVKRIERAGRALCATLSGYRAEHVEHAAWVKYAAQRKQQVAPDTVHFELSVARRAYHLARVAGLVRSIPEFPQIKNLNVRSGFVEARQWGELRARLDPDLRDAGDFAFLCGAREMETLALAWADVESEPCVVHFRSTKSGRPRAVPYGHYPELAEVIARRAAVRERLRRAGVITPWVFCFSEPARVRGRLYHPAGAPLFKPSGERGLLSALREHWQRACENVGLPGLLFHDLRRSAARNFERAGMPRGVAMKLGGWTERMYSRYAIGAESEVDVALSRLSDYVRSSGWHFGGTAKETATNSGRFVAEGGRSRTFRRA